MNAQRARAESGRFWRDRRPRSEYRLPGTREPGPDMAQQLWENIADLVPVWTLDGRYKYG